MQVTLAKLDDTRTFGQVLGRLLYPGAVVALVGPLGAGKTHLTRAVAEGLEVPDSRVVTSPTFVLIQEYEGRLPIYHFDAYRLAGEQSFADLGSEEYFTGQGVCLVEWADRVRGCLPADHLVIELEPTGETSRRVTVTAHGERSGELLRALASQVEDQAQPRPAVSAGGDL